MMQQESCCAEGTEYGPQYCSPFRCEMMKFQAPKPVSVNLKEDYSIPERCMGMRHMLRKFKGEDVLPAPCAGGHDPPALGHGEVLGVSLTCRWAAGWGGILAEAFGLSRLCGRLHVHKGVCATTSAALLLFVAELQVLCQPPPNRLCQSPSRFGLLFNDMTSE